MVSSSHCLLKDHHRHGDSDVSDDGDGDYEYVVIEAIESKSTGQQGNSVLVLFEEDTQPCCRKIFSLSNYFLCCRMKNLSKYHWIVTKN